MEIDSILKAIERFLESIEGAYFEPRALQMKYEVKEAINNHLLQLKVDGAYEEYLSQHDD